MAKRNGFLMRLCAGVLLLVLCGCRHNYPVAGIMKPGAAVAALVYSDSKSPNILLHVDEDRQTLTYVTSAVRAPDGQGLVRTYDFNGSLVDKSYLPVFRCTGWMDSFDATWGGAVSPNRDYIVYLEHQYPLDRGACDLVCLNVSTGARHVLVKKLAKEPQELAWLAWINPDEITVATHRAMSQNNQARLMIVDAPRATVRLDLPCVFPRKFAVSRSRRYLAYSDGGRTNAGTVIKILDLKTMTAIAETESGDLETFGRLEWNADDTKLAYVMDNQLRTYCLAVKRSETLLSLGVPKDSCSSVALQGYVNGVLYYRAEDPRDHVERLQGFEETTRTQRHFKNHPEGPFNAYICGDGSIIYYKLGHEPLY